MQADASPLALPCILEGARLGGKSHPPRGLLATAKSKPLAWAIKRGVFISRGLVAPANGFWRLLIIAPRREAFLTPQPCTPPMQGAQGVSHSARILCPPTPCAFASRGRKRSHFYPLATLAPCAIGFRAFAFLPPHHPCALCDWLACLCISAPSPPSAPISAHGFARSRLGPVRPSAGLALLGRWGWVCGLAGSLGWLGLCAWLCWLCRLALRAWAAASHSRVCALALLGLWAGSAGSLGWL